MLLLPCGHSWAPCSRSRTAESDGDIGDRESLGPSFCGHTHVCLAAQLPGLTSQAFASLPTQGTPRLATWVSRKGHWSFSRPTPSGSSLPRGTWVVLQPGAECPEGQPKPLCPPTPDLYPQHSPVATERRVGRRKAPGTLPWVPGPRGGSVCYQDDNYEILCPTGSPARPYDSPKVPPRSWQ